MLALENADIGYGRHRILSGVNLTIRRGEFWGFLGPNGRGKTTLVNTILGRHPVSRGDVRRDRLVVGFAPQVDGRSPRLPTTVTEFILGGAVGLRLSRDERVKRLDGVLDTVGLADRRQHRLHTLSGGQTRRAVVARALLREPDLLVLDEPAAGLDIAAATSIIELLRTLHREQGLTVVMVTHNLRVVHDLATHAVLFMDGTVRSGPVADVVDPDSVATAFEMSSSIAARLLMAKHHGETITQ